MAVVVPLVAWLGLLRWQFGTIVPGTLDAKRAQVGLGYWPIYRPEQIRLYLWGFLGAVGLGLLAVGLVGILVRPDRAAVAVVVWLGFAVGAAGVYTLTA